MSFMKKLEVLCTARNLADADTRVNEYFNVKIREICRQLVSYLKVATYIRKDRLVVSRRV
jgi:hypothetical protein